MAWTDFDYHIYESSADMAVALDPVTPVVGVSSLSITRVSGAGVGAVAWTPKNTLSPRGVTRGVLRIYSRPSSAPSNDNSNDHFGLSCMHNQSNVLASGTCYAARVHGHAVQIIKASNGVLNSPTVLASVDVVFPGGNTLVVQTLQLLWVADQQVELGGVYLQAFFSLGASTGPAAVLEVVDVGSPYWTSTIEGAYTIASYGAAFDFKFDQHHMEGPA